MSAVDTIVLVCPLALWRDCVGRVLAAEFPTVPILAFPDLRAWHAVGDWHGQSPLLVIFEIGRNVDLGDLNLIIRQRPDTRTVIISDDFGLSRAFKSINISAKAYISIEKNLEVAMKSIQLLMVDGCFLYASTFLEDLSERKSKVPTYKAADRFNISRRQLEVISGIRRGKSNAHIAQDLNISEATIKVHIRNIMKKMGVNTRTAIAYEYKEAMRY